MLFKVYLQNEDSTIKAIRQFMIESPKQVRKKVRKMFLELCPTDDFTISWKDSTDDLIVASTEEELQYAFTGTKGTLYITIIPPKKEATNHHYKGIVHPHVKCDSCDGNVIGFRYKCIQCVDFDLCARCEARGRHSQHYMIRMSQTFSNPYNVNFNQYLRDILERNDVSYNKKIAFDECISQEIHYAIAPWLEICKPYLNNLIDAWMKEHIDPYLLKTEKEEKEEKEEKLPEEKKLIDNSEDDKESVSNNGNHDESVTKVITDEWTIIDKSDTTEGNQACSISSNVDETANQACSTSTNVDETANQACSTSSNINETEEEKISFSPLTPTAPEESSSSQTLYPQLLKEKKVVHHQNPIINEVVETMIKMGFSNQGGLLSYLLEDENGDINKVLEILQPANKH